MNYAANGFRDDADARVIMPTQNQRQADPRRGGSSTRSVRDTVTARRKRVAPRIRQRDLTKIMKAARAAGMASFELVDVESGFIIRASTASERPATSDDLDLELQRFMERVGG